MGPEYENIVFHVNTNPKAIPAMNSLVLTNVNEIYQMFPSNIGKCPQSH